MKVAISLPDKLFAEADLAAERLGMSRSGLYTQALSQFLAKLDPDPVTQRLDELADEGSSADWSGAGAGRLLIEQGSWDW
ncbi:MAG: hypothetical protein ACT4OM_10685 [Actinomycetota bacterium]